MRTGYSVSSIASIVGAYLYGNVGADFVVENILLDSRLLVSAEKTLFFAIVTERNDGHKYIKSLYDKGVRAFVVNVLPPDMPYAVFIKVDDTLEALQNLAAFHRHRFSMPVIGITGSNGKTMVKEWLYQLLSPDYSIVRSPKSYNSQTGVPLSVWQMKEDDQLAVFEAGISQPGEMCRLRSIICPTIGIFTNIGQAHDENFSDINQKVQEKMQLFKDVGVLVYCLDYKYINSVIAKQDLKCFSWSRYDTAADVFIESIVKEDDKTYIIAHYRNDVLDFMIPFIDDASIENLMHCLCIMLLFNKSADVIKERMSHLVPIAMRMELKSAINNCIIINDYYNSDFNALSIALDFMCQQQRHNNKVVVLSDILQSGMDEQELYSRIASLLENKGVDMIIGIGEAVSRNKDLFHLEKYFYNNTDDFLKDCLLEKFHNDIILLKGARCFEFERISMMLQEKTHETVLEINLDNLVLNMNYYRSKIKNDTKLMVMVKAFAYGSGNFEISNVLEFHHADYLTVAFADEGVELRNKGIALPIMVMSPEKNAFENIIRYDLEPEIYSLRSLFMLESAMEQMKLPADKIIKIHVKLDTGMHRLGFLPDDIEELIVRLKSNPHLKVQSIFSHLAGSDNPELYDFTMQQIRVFEEGSCKIVEAFPYKILRHVLNTAGISRFTDYQYDMVRLGIGIYGIAPCEEDKGKLHTVASLKSSITQIKTLNEGESVGYNRHGMLKRRSRIGIIPIGYADGLPRLLGNGNASFRIHGCQAPVVGDICMDMCMVDLTDIEDVNEGDAVVLFDEVNRVEDLAKACNTIPYEILTGISQRVKRVYVKD